MTNQPKRYSEEDRIRDLELIRTPQNSHVIDEAIRNGATAQHTALKIVQAGLHRSEEELEQEMVDHMVTYANEYMQNRGDYRSPAAAQNQPQPTGDPDVDAIVAEIHRLRR